MSQYLQGMSAAELLQKVEAGEISVEHLPDILSFVPLPEAGVAKLSEARSFQVDSGALRVTDPCYEMDVWCAGTLPNVKNGRWMAFTLSLHCIDELNHSLKWRNQRIQELIERLRGVAEGEKHLPQLVQRWVLNDFLRSDAGFLEPDDGRVHYLHIHHADHPVTECDDTWISSDIHVGVDSGQACFADLGWYEGEAAWKTHYKAVCELTQANAVTLQNRMAACLSGYGDGGYPLSFKTDDSGQVIAARITFIGHNTEEDPE